MKAFNKRKKNKPLFNLGKRISFITSIGMIWSVKKKNRILYVRVVNRDKYKSILDRD